MLINMNEDTWKTIDKKKKKKKKKPFEMIW